MCDGFSHSRSQLRPLPLHSRESVPICPYRTGQPQPARRVQKQQNVFTGAVALARIPQPIPTLVSGLLVGGGRPESPLALGKVIRVVATLAKSGPRCSTPSTVPEKINAESRANPRRKGILVKEDGGVFACTHAGISAMKTASQRCKRTFSLTMLRPALVRGAPRF